MDNMQRVRDFVTLSPKNPFPWGIRELWERGDRKKCKSQRGQMTPRTQCHPDTTGLVYNELTETITTHIGPAQVQVRQGLSAERRK